MTPCRASGHRCRLCRLSRRELQGAVSGASAAETIPAKPTRYFNDYALTVKPETADRLNKELEDLEKRTSNQIVAVIYPQCSQN